MDDTPVANSTPSEHSGGNDRPARLAVIAAVARNGVIGVDNGMPWHLPGDLRHFRALTTGHRIVMGRRTWQALGRPLPHRENVVVTRDRAFVADGCVVVHSLGAALAGGTMPAPVFCIGGAALYAQALPLADRLHLTEIDAAFDGDTRMPPIDFTGWVERSRRTETDPATRLRYAFVEYVRAEAGVQPDAQGE